MTCLIFYSRIFSLGYFRYKFARSGTGFPNNTRYSVCDGVLDRPCWWLPFSVPISFCSCLLPLFFCLARSRCLLKLTNCRQYAKPLSAGKKKRALDDNETRSSFYENSKDTFPDSCFVLMGQAECAPYPLKPISTP